MRTSNYNLASMLHGRTILTLTTAIGMSLFAFAPLQAQDTLPENNGIISITSQDDGDGSSSADNDSAQLAMAAAAQNGDNNSSSFTISGNATIVSDYRFRGVSLSDGDFAIQGGIDISHDSGFYAGIWGSSIEDSPAFGHSEIDIYGGWSGEIASGITADAGMLVYIYPNGEDRDINGDRLNSDYWETFGSLTGDIGPLSATLGIAYSWDQAALGNDDNIYIFTDLSSAIPGTPISVNGHLGLTDGALSAQNFGGNNGSSFDWAIGADWAITKNLTAGVKYTGVEGPSINDFTDDAFVFSIGVSF